MSAETVVKTLLDAKEWSPDELEQMIKPLVSSYANFMAKTGDVKESEVRWITWHTSNVSNDRRLLANLRIEERIDTEIPMLTIYVRAWIVGSQLPETLNNLDVALPLSARPIAAGMAKEMWEKLVTLINHPRAQDGGYSVGAIRTSFPQILRSFKRGLRKFKLS